MGQRMKKKGGAGPRRGLSSFGTAPRRRTRAWGDRKARNASTKGKKKSTATLREKNWYIDGVNKLCATLMARRSARTSHDKEGRVWLATWGYEKKSMDAVTETLMQKEVKPLLSRWDGERRGEVSLSTTFSTHWTGFGVQWRKKGCR